MSLALSSDLGDGASAPVRPLVNMRELAVQLRTSRQTLSVWLDRWPDFPEVPTLIEQGYGTATRQLIVWAGPAGLPGPIRERLEGALMAAARDPEVQARQAAGGIASRVIEGARTLAAIREVQPGVEAALVASGMSRKRG